MLIYPQLTSGALGQFPIVRRRRARTILNAAADGSAVKLGDPAAAGTEWQLAYAGLSDTELAALQQFFLAAEGSLNGFTFVDPTANLLAWSEVLSNSVWNADPFLTLQGGVADAAGGTNAWQLSNTSAGAQSLTQTLNAPGGYLYCFSVYVRADQAAAVTVSAGTKDVVHAAGSAWTRIAATGSGGSNGTSVAFAIQVPAGCAIDMFGPQVEAQGAPSVYQTSTTGGIYEGARFRDDVFSFTTQGANRNSATVNIFYANYL
jgi:hypothetical protein